MGYEQWFEEMTGRYSCGRCGTFKSTYHLICRACGSQLSNAYVAAQRAETVAHLQNRTGQRVVHFVLLGSRLEWQRGRDQGTALEALEQSTGGAMTLRPANVGQVTALRILFDMKLLQSSCAMQVQRAFRPRRFSGRLSFCWIGTHLKTEEN